MSFATSPLDDSDFGRSRNLTPAPASGRRGCFEIDRFKKDLIIEPTLDIGELDYWRLEAELDRVHEMFDWTDSQRMVFDLSAIPWSDSAAVALFVALSKRSGVSRDNVLFRGLSKGQRDSIAASGLTTLWPVADESQVGHESGVHDAIPVPC